MDNQRFFDWMRNLYGAFGKNAPQPHVVAAAFKRIEGLPDRFFDYASEKLEEREALPQNLGRELRSVLWPNFLSVHPELRSHANDCPECGGSGFILMRIDTGRPGCGQDKAFQCVCRAGNDEGWTYSRIMQAGYKSEQYNTENAVNSRQALSELGVVLGVANDDRAFERVQRLPEAERYDYADYPF